MSIVGRPLVTASGMPMGLPEKGHQICMTGARSAPVSGSQAPEAPSNVAQRSNFFGSRLRVTNCYQAPTTRLHLPLPTFCSIERTDIDLGTNGPGRSAQPQLQNYALSTIQHLPILKLFRLELTIVKSRSRRQYSVSLNGENSPRALTSGLQCRTQALWPPPC